MKRYQVQTKLGFVLGIYEGITAREALDRLAKEKGYQTFPEWAKEIGFDPAYNEIGHRIILL